MFIKFYILISKQEVEAENEVKQETEFRTSGLYR